MQQMVQIDISACAINPNRRVWRMFPGDGYKFLADFLDQEVGFMDLPAFPMPEGDLRNSYDLIRRIAFSSKARDLLLTGNSQIIDTLRLDEFRAAKSTQNRGRIRNAFVNFMQIAGKDDLIVLPSPAYMGNVHIGRFIDKDKTIGHYRRYGPVEIPARNVKWIATFKENTVSAGLSASLRHPHPFNLLEKSKYNEVFALAYSSFIFENTHVATVYNDDDFLDTDNSFLGNISKISAAACFAAERGLSFDANRLLSILISETPIDFACVQEADIHSPGFTRWISASVTCLVAAALIASFTQLGSAVDNPNSLRAEIEKLEFVNLSAGENHDVTRKVSEASKLVLSSLSIDITWELCKACRAANDRAGLRSSARRR